MQQWRARPPAPVPKDALAVLHNTTLYAERHTRRSLACFVGERVHFQMLIRSIGADGGGWDVVENSTWETKRTAALLVQTAFGPARRPRIPHAVWATFAPPREHQNPLDRLVSALGNTTWSALKTAHPQWALVAAELPALLPRYRFRTYTGPHAKPRYLCPIIDAVAVSHDSGRVAIVDYKIALGARPFVSASHVAQIIVNAGCFQQMTNIMPDVCVLIYTLRCGESHVLEFPFSLKNAFISRVLEQAIDAIPVV
jgi:hypothetical protein